jgi:AcrR family transcriptional regulator
MKKRAPKRPAHERKRLILQGAEAAFANGSYAGTATADVAREAGVTAPAVYRYFPTKKDLYISTLEAAGQRLHSIWKRMIDASDDPAQAIWDIGIAYYDHLQGHSPVTRLWFRALAEAADPEVRSALAENMVAAVDLLEQNLKRGQVMGIVRKDFDPRIAAWQVMGIGLIFDLVHMLDLDGELDHAKVEEWGRLYLESVRGDRNAD